MSENLLAGRIAQLRKEAGMTQEQLGNALGHWMICLAGRPHSPSGRRSRRRRSAPCRGRTTIPCMR